MTHPQGEGRRDGSAQRLLSLTGVSRASYYRHWAASAPRAEEADLRDLVQRLALAHRFYGYRRITELARRQGWPVNRKRIARIMREDNLLALKKPVFKPATTDSRHSWRVWPNLARHLRPMAPDQLWVADITYVRLAEAFVYLAVLLDAFSRKVVGWAMAEHLRAELALEALEMALSHRLAIPGGLVHHSDRGVQYACGDYIDRLQAAGVQPSMSRAGCPYDNAMAESFMKTLKHEEVHASDYRDLADAKLRIGQFIETIYNRQRLHSALEYLSPTEFEANQPKPWTAIPHTTEISTNVPNITVSSEGGTPLQRPLRVFCAFVVKPLAGPRCVRIGRRLLAPARIVVF
jgi:putative transposase